MANQNVAYIERHWAHSNFGGFHSSKRFRPRHAVSAWGNFNRAMVRRYPE
jgi:hypothetical protein